MSYGNFQCPKCDYIWSPGKNDLTEKLNWYRGAHARALKKREDHMNKPEEEHATAEWQAERLRIQATILEVEAAARAISAELRHKPVQMWQMRYNMAMLVAKDFMTPSQYEKFCDTVDAACRPKKEE